ncbi:MAG: AAA family ATPase [Propionibacteriaceae bacterium]
MLLGRGEECARLDELVGALRTGESRVLVLQGDPGIGKSALLAYVERGANGVRVLRAPGVEGEQDLEFAALHRLCVPLLGGLGNLPQPQRTALETAFGVSAGPRPDHFLVGLAVLTLMTHASADHPLLCLVDDAHWLDHSSAQVLAFVARRLLAESIAVLFATDQHRHPFLGLPEMEVPGLAIADAEALLGAVVPAGFDPRVRERILAEARGNPLALLELPRGLTVTQVASGLGLVGVDSVPGPLEHTFLERIKGLPARTQLVMLVAATDPSGDPQLLRRAVERLGVRDAVAVTDDADGLLTVGARVTFRHPSVRSAAYRAAGAKARRAAHRTLAEVTDPKADADRRAWHRAAAASVTDEALALELERVAELARARGGLAAEAAFLQRATALTEEQARRSERALAAARVSLRAGDVAAAQVYLDEADRCREGDALLLPIQLARAQLALASGSWDHAGSLLLSAGQQLAERDLSLARETYLNAWGAAAAGGDETRLLEVSRLIGALPAPDNPQLMDRLLSGYARLVVGDRATAVGILQPAGAAMRTSPPEDLLRLGWAASGLGPTLWDDGLFRSTCRIQVQTSREQGALIELARHLTSLALTTAWSGDFGEAGSLIAEAELLAAATGRPADLHAPRFLAALQGDELAMSAQPAPASRRTGRSGPVGGGTAVAQWSAAVLYNGLASYELAAEAARRAAALPTPWSSAWALPELVEAAVRVGDAELADWALTRLVEATEPCPTDWARGISARCRALRADADHADDLFADAIRHLARTSWRPELARAQLLYGEWLRREGRRVDGRQQLQAALDAFETIGMAAFAERARRELLATGGTLRRRSVGAAEVADLTPQERQIADLVRDGHTNTEVAARLFLSPRTVEWHLRKVFTKLSITSRRQLREALSPGPRSTGPATR